MSSIETIEKQELFLRQVPKFASDTAEILVKDFLVNHIKAKMEAGKLPPKVIDAVHVEDFRFDYGTGGIHYETVAEYVKERTNPDGVVEYIPLSQYFEEGTPAHRINPRWARFLSWIQDEVRRFSGGHVVSGVGQKQGSTPLKLIEKTELEARSMIGEKYREKLRELYKRTVGEEMEDDFL